MKTQKFNPEIKNEDVLAQINYVDKDYNNHVIVTIIGRYVHLPVKEQAKIIRELEALIEHLR